MLQRGGQRIRCSLAFAMLTLLKCCESFSVKIGGKNYPEEFCTTSGRAIPLNSALDYPPGSSLNMSLTILARLIRFGDDICRLNELMQRNSSAAEPLSVFAQSADLRYFCRLSATPPRKRQPYYLAHQKPNSQCESSIRDNKYNMAWEHLKIYRFQTCVLLFLMCLCCYVYGRIFSMKISPITRLRRLNWTTENFIWAYKNF